MSKLKITSGANFNWLTVFPDRIINNAKILKQETVVWIHKKKTIVRKELMDKVK